MDFEPYPCPQHPWIIVDGTIINPYVQELYGREVEMPNCGACYHEACMDI
jgi:hypothetical protein